MAGSVVQHPKLDRLGWFLAFVFFVELCEWSINSSGESLKRDGNIKRIEGFIYTTYMDAPLYKAQIAWGSGNSWVKIETLLASAIKKKIHGRTAGSPCAVWDLEIKHAHYLKAVLKI